MSTLRSFTSFLVQVFAVVVALVGIAILAQAVHPDTPSSQAVAIAGWTVAAVSIAALVLGKTRPVRYLFALAYAIADWLTTRWERLSYFIAGLGVLYVGGYLEWFTTNHYWANPSGWLYVIGCGLLGIVLCFAGILRSVIAENDNGSTRDAKDAFEYCRMATLP